MKIIKNTFHKITLKYYEKISTSPLDVTITNELPP